MLDIPELVPQYHDSHNSYHIIIKDNRNIFNRKLILNIANKKTRLAYNTVSNYYISTQLINFLLLYIGLGVYFIISISRGLMRLILNILCFEFIIIKSVEEPKIKYITFILSLAAYSKADL
jgi:hypothetical protein